MADKNETFVSISLTEYSNLLRDSEFLAALEEAGVDNWEGYATARKLVEELDN